MRPLLGCALALSALVPVGAANAAQTLDVSMTFQSGATFQGTVTFADDFSSFSDVTGTLFGYQGGEYTGTGSTDINWVWTSTNASTGAYNYSNWLMNGVQGGAYDTWIQLAYNYSNPANLTFTSGVSQSDYDNWINYRDAFVSGSFGAAGAVPEPGTWAMMLIGFGAVGFAMRRKRPSGALPQVA